MFTEGLVLSLHANLHIVAERPNDSMSSNEELTLGCSSENCMLWRETT